WSNATATFTSRHSLEQRRSAGDDVVDGEPEALEHLVSRSGGAEALQRERVAPVSHPALPALGDSGLDREPRGDLRREHLLAILERLQLEELPAGHRDDPDVRPVLLGDPPTRSER